VICVRISRFAFEDLFDDFAKLHKFIEIRRFAEVMIHTQGRDAVGVFRTSLLESSRFLAGNFRRCPDPDRMPVASVLQAARR
jgi:hypothetical protein